MKEETIYMKDTNILFYLAAQRQRTFIEDFLRNERTHESCETFYEELETLDFCGFNYHVIDYVLVYFKNKKEMYTPIISLMKYVINIAHSKKISNKHINKKMAFFYLLFIKIYSGDYTSSEMYRHVFKDLFLISKSLREAYSKEKHHYTIERYFMNLNIKSAIIKRLNLKHYNFKGSTIKSTSFKQCKFYKNSFEDTCINKLDFKHSSLNKIAFDLKNEERLNLMSYGSDYNICFSNCTIMDLKISNSDITIFKSCNIENLDVTFKQSNQLLFFDNCKISKLKVSSSMSSCRTNFVVFRLVDFINKINKDPSFCGRLCYIENVDDKHDFIKIEHIDQVIYEEV